LETGLADGSIETAYVGFDRAFFTAQFQLLFEVDRAVTNPAYTLTHRSDDGDVAVLLLKESVTARAPGIRPARLPTAGLLEDMAAQGGLHGVKIPAVGYGDALVHYGNGQPFTYGFGFRSVGVQEYRALGPGYLTASMNPATGEGGTCYGDSGGPNFLGDSDILIGLTVWGDTWCRALSKIYRLDTEAARTFLRDIRTPRLRPLVVLEMPMREVYGDHWSTTGRVPGFHATDASVYIPGRNVMLFAKAAVFCALRRLPVLFLGILSANPFPDGSPGFLRAMERALARGLAAPIRLRAPFRRLTKDRVIRRGRGLPLALTLSCSTPRRGRHCGV